MLRCAKRNVIVVTLVFLYIQAITSDYRYPICRPLGIISEEVSQLLDLDPTLSLLSPGGVLFHGREQSETLAEEDIFLYELTDSRIQVMGLRLGLPKSVNLAGGSDGEAVGGFPP